MHLKETIQCDNGATGVTPVTLKQVEQQHILQVVLRESSIKLRLGLHPFLKNFQALEKAGERSLPFQINSFSAFQPRVTTGITFASKKVGLPGTKDDISLVAPARSTAQALKQMELPIFSNTRLCPKGPSGLPAAFSQKASRNHSSELRGGLSFCHFNQLTSFPTLEAAGSDYLAQHSFSLKIYEGRVSLSFSGARALCCSDCFVGKHSADTPRKHVLSPLTPSLEVQRRVMSQGSFERAEWKEKGVWRKQKRAMRVMHLLYAVMRVHFEDSTWKCAGKHVAKKWNTIHCSIFVTCTCGGAHCSVSS
ncbi:hypothetical protein CEXT_724201 [Caerostris extrusa]|uniref:Uncharacterized protein n=1 Tax=Caerostris extrusa TaxID=172846 RepID=A0AAV4PE87_CAEEX|nr:hypothetical protein CEXT_724201 [Caerostris extrusa]